MRGVLARCKIENETFNTLKNQGYHLEHNYGHGEQNLSVVLALLMMLAFLVDQVQQLCCPLFQAACHKMKTKCHLWEELRHHFRLLLFGSMAELLTSRYVASHRRTQSLEIRRSRAPMPEDRRVALLREALAAWRSRCAVNSRNRPTTA